MTKIAIDARELRQSTGRYVERLIHYLQQIDHADDHERRADAGEPAPGQVVVAVEQHREREQQKDDAECERNVA